MLQAVLFEFCPALAVPRRELSSSLLYKVTQSSVWFDYEKNLLTRVDCQRRLADTLGLTVTEISDAIQAIPQLSLPLGLADLRSEFPSIKFFAVGNASLNQLEKFEAYSRQEPLCPIPVLASCQLGERLPHAAFVSRLLELGQLEPSQTLYISHNPEHVAAAQTGGFQTLLYENEAQCTPTIRKLCSNPTRKGLLFLKAQAGRLDLHTSSGKTLKDVFCQMLIMEALHDESLVYLPQGPPPFNWRYDNATHNVPVYSKPACVDTNAVGLSVLSHVTADQRNIIMDRMLRLRDSAGVMQVYFSHELIRQDIGVAINALALFHEFGRGDELKDTEDWIFNTLRTGSHQYSSHYYTTPDLILFFVSRLLQKAPGLRSKFQPLLRDSILERKAVIVDSMSLAARLLAAAQCAIRDDAAVRTLIISQEDSGGWPAGAIYKSPQSGELCYHQGLTTAWAIQAIRAQEDLAELADIADLANFTELASLSLQRDHVSASVGNPASECLS